jgi:O-methyltransferase
MENVILYGAGGCGEELYCRFSESKEYRVLCFADSAVSRHGTKKCGLSVVSPEQIKDYEYDYIIVAARTGLDSITATLTGELNIPKGKIIRKYVEFTNEARITFLKNCSELIYERCLQGNIAEGGVFQGEFASYINQYFPDRKLYLFDTFEGFDQRDIDTDRKNHFSSHYVKGDFDGTNIELVRNRMPHKENCIFKKGYFPETAHDVDDRFVFVNLDFDLYNPILAGLEFFYPKIVEGGGCIAYT